MAAAPDRTDQASRVLACLECGERTTSPTAVTCGNAESVIEVNIRLAEPDSVG
jgi:hypothetical protein